MFGCFEVVLGDSWGSDLRGVFGNCVGAMSLRVFWESVLPGTLWGGLWGVSFKYVFSCLGEMSLRGCPLGRVFAGGLRLEVSTVCLAAVSGSGVSSEVACGMCLGHVFGDVLDGGLIC